MPQRNERPPSQPPPNRLPAERVLRDEILRRHAAALAAGSPGYIDPGTGLFVMTAQTHLERGRCCRSGCRHCPYR